VEAPAGERNRIVRIAYGCSEIRYGRGMASQGRPRLGLIVNPIAGMGGPLALKGTDGGALARAEALGALPIAPERARRALAALSTMANPPAILAAPGVMGGDLARGMGFAVELAAEARSGRTTAADTRRAALAMRAAGIDLLLFCGGDGTARDVYAAVGASLPVLGVPAGVKMHSAVFATSPAAAGRVAAEFLSGAPGVRLVESDILDRDWNGQAAPSPRLYGVALTPRAPFLVQSGKAAGGDDEAGLSGAVEDAAELVRGEALAFLGPGSTMARVKRALGFPGTLLGVDVARHGRLLLADAAGPDLLRLARSAEAPPRIVVGVVGGQGFLFGRGNQQLGADVIAAAGRDRLTIVASEGKLLSLDPPRLLVDLDDEGVAASLAGYLPVLTGRGRRTLMRVVPA